MSTISPPSLPLLLLLLLLAAAAAAQPYKATDHFLLDCGSATSTATDPRWDSDFRSKFVPSNITTTSFSSTAASQDPPVQEIPYSTARIINTSSFTYTFPVSNGPKFLRLYFYPATYSDLNPNQSFFSVSSNGYSLLTNFSAFLTVSAAVKRPVLIKEFTVYVKDTQILSVTFTPSPNSYAFINGIEIVSLPENLYYNVNDLNYVSQTTGPVIDDEVALETVYRLNAGGAYIADNSDTGMFRSWDQDDDYVFPPKATGLTPFYDSSITYTVETPNYTAPDLVYKTQRSMGLQATEYNLTWVLPVDSGFYYMLRLHFCNIIPQYTKSGEVIFRIFINNLTAENEADLFFWTQGSGYPVFKDYVVFVAAPDDGRSKQDLWLAMHPNLDVTNGYADAYLNGLEAFKLSLSGNLAGPNPEVVRVVPPPPVSPKKGGGKGSPPYAAIIGGVGGGLVVVLVLVLVVLRRGRRVKSYGASVNDKSSYGPDSIESNSTKSGRSSLPSNRCRHFSLKELKVATSEFDDSFVIGNGGFGKVYKGYMDNATTTVAIKRLNPLSNQGFHEFETEIKMLSKLRHIHLVSLIGYCDDDEEMVLVYDYMAHGTLREHLYRSNNPPLSWKRRLQICIGAAQGLLYLHTGAKRTIIHRDVKSTNILLDEKWVAKVSDFGLSKQGPKDLVQTHVSTVVKGSIGYVDPEYYRRQQLTDKSDVYSFGVVLLEVLCARPVMIPGLPKEQVNLAAWGKYCYRRGTLHQIIDPKLRGEVAPECLRKFGEVANSCLKEQGTERPAMADVVWGLEFALKLQEDAEKTGGVEGEGRMMENQDFPFLMQGELTTTDDDVFTGSAEAPLRNEMLTSSSHGGFKSETVFSEMLKHTGR